MYDRQLNLPRDDGTSFFLWGVRQSGKSTLLKQRFPDAHFVDLLRGEEYDRYRNQPHRLREELLADEPSEAHRVVIDEVQRVPDLLNEAHWLIENKGFSFAICSSNARKLRRGGVNLLGGRALRYRLYGLSAYELADDFDLLRLLNTGFVPSTYDSESWEEYARDYVYDHVVTEVAIGAEVRNLSSFSTFLRSAALADTDIVNYSNIAADCGVASPTVKSYYEILIDSMHGDWLPAFRLRPKRRITKMPKFYFADVGVVNVLARRNRIEPESLGFGQAFESWVLHELCAYIDYARLRESLSYWRLSTGTEVDFVVGNMRVAIEAKATQRITNRHLKGLRNLIADHPEVGHRVVVCRESRHFVTDDNIEVLSVSTFIEKLWTGELIERTTG